MRKRWSLWWDDVRKLETDNDGSFNVSNVFPIREFGVWLLTYKDIPSPHEEYSTEKDWGLNDVSEKIMMKNVVLHSESKLFIFQICIVLTNIYYFPLQDSVDSVSLFCLRVWALQNFLKTFLFKVLEGWSKEGNKPQHHFGSI